ncbi:hypothetical protein LX77_01801 [Gelidibacter algens]|uniref:Uncharacterized protein n=1 Tax=Gelidibacter algens TaxID=49280 RepID=A0A1A7R4B1_9FLAO|nr:hypothetical protein [Gelidibacter algens]OBX26309.1 hypothetical protein A9996_05930 [Gelidibacter algens]RAJ24803.1 hypothetical protein LX77_01801 [Gelidibacter algens]
MTDILHHIVPKLEPFDYSLHHDTQFINQEWVLINGIEDAKAMYLFKPNNELFISENDHVTKTRWSFINSNFLSITTEDGIVLIKAFYKDKDTLVLNQKASEDYAFFINSSDYDITINTKEDIQKYLKEKYLKKATELISDHQFYYIQRFKEYGPYTMKELVEKVKTNAINAYCLVRDVNESDYSKKLRIKDILQEL